MVQKISRENSLLIFCHTEFIILLQPQQPGKDIQ